MKLATLKDGSRDGQLIVVARDLAQAHAAGHIAGTLQRVLDDWNFLSPQLEDLYATLNGGKARHAFAFDPRQCMAPLPRAHQWLQFNGAAADEASAVRRASDDFLGPCDAALFSSDSLDLHPGLAVIVADLDPGADAGQALDAVRLLMLTGAWAWPLHPDAEPAAVCAPLAVTADELGDEWRGGRAALALECSVNGRRIDGAAGLAQPFGELIARLARHRRLRAGAIVGVGPGATATATASALRFGDRVQLQALARDGHSVFGAIDQTVTARDAAAPA